MNDDIFNKEEGETANNSGEDENDLEKGDADKSKKEEDAKKQEEKDPNLVEWDGPDDPGNPMNWNRNRRWGITLALGMMTFCVTFASSVFSNATVPVAELYHVSTEVTTLGTSLFVLGFAVGPLVSKALSPNAALANETSGLGSCI